MSANTHFSTLSQFCARHDTYWKLFSARQRYVLGRYFMPDRLYVAFAGRHSFVTAFPLRIANIMYTHCKSTALSDSKRHMHLVHTYLCFMPSCMHIPYSFLFGDRFLVWRRAETSVEVLHAGVLQARRADMAGVFLGWPGGRGGGEDVLTAAHTRSRPKMCPPHG